MNNRQPHIITEEEYALIEAYLLGDTDNPATIEIEQRIKIDAVFREKVEELRFLSIGIAEASLQKKLDEFHESIDGELATVHTLQRRPRNLYTRWLAVAASILIVASAAWLMLRPAGTHHEQLYSAYFSPDIGLPVAMGSADSATYSFYDGMINYKEEKYAEAISKWQAIARSSGYTDTLRYYIGMARLNNKEEQQAEQELTELLKMENSTYRDDAYWYLALIRLKKNDGRGAANYLDKIKADREEARELLSKIKP